MERVPAASRSTPDWMRTRLHKEKKEDEEAEREGGRGGGRGEYHSSSSSSSSSSSPDEDWITELIHWVKKRRREGLTGEWVVWDTKVNPADLTAFTEKHFHILQRKAGLRKRVTNKRNVLYFVWKGSGREEPAYLATRKLPLTLPDEL